MGTQCKEPYCLQIVPDHLYASHQDQHLAERLAAEEFERQQQQLANDLSLARQLEAEGSGNVPSGDTDYQLALQLSMGDSDSEGLFQQGEEDEQGIHEEKKSVQLILGDDLVPIRSQLLSNEITGNPTDI
jgi:hypothetical protein